MGFRVEDLLLWLLKLESLENALNLNCFSFAHILSTFLQVYYSGNRIRKSKSGYLTLT